MDESKPLPSIPISKDHAVRHRDGLIFALAAFIPLRSKNLAALEIGSSLGPGGRWLVCDNSGRGNEDGNAHRVPSPRTPGNVSCYLSRHCWSATAPASNLFRALGQ